MSLAWWQTPQGKKLIGQHIPKLANNIGRLNEILEELLPKADLQAEIVKRGEKIAELEAELNKVIREKDQAETTVMELESQLESATKVSQSERWGQNNPEAG